MTMTRRAVLSATGTAAAAAVLPVAPSVGVVRRRRRFAGDPGAGRLYYGAATDLDLATWERSLGQRLAVHRTFHRPDGSGSLVTRVAADLKAGRMPHVSTKCPGSWEAMASGYHDRWLRGLRHQLAAIDRPVLLTFHHEPENDTRQPDRTAADYVAMQTHIIDLFARRAPKVTIVPVLMSWTFDPRNRHARPEAWNVPAAKVFGVDVYNPFCAANPVWETFESRLQRVLPLAGDRPIVVGEYGCRNDPADPSRATTWMRDAFSVARDSNVVAMSYYHSGLNAPDEPWYLKGGGATVFRNRLNAPRVVRLDVS